MSLQFKTKYVNDKTDPFHEYLDIDLYHQTENGSPAPLTFSTTRTVPFLDCPEKYFLSIVRFSIDLQLPVFIPKLNYTYLTSTPYTPFDPNLTDYWIGIYNTSNISPEMFYIWVDFSPENETLTVPTSYDPSNKYYHTYVYTSFINKLNIALKAVHDAAGFSTGAQPYFTLDSSTLNISLVFPNLGIYTADGDIYVNQPLQRLLTGLSFTTTNFTDVYTPVVAGQPVPSSNTLYKFNLGTPTPVGSVTVATTQTSPLSTWNPVKSLVFTSNTLPIIQSSEATEKVYGTNVTFGSNESNNVTGSILTDFVVAIGPNSLYSPFVLYIPSSEYRLIDLYGSSPLSKFDVQVYWKDKYNNLNLVLLPSGGGASMKVLFRKKSFNTTSKNLLV